MARGWESKSIESQQQDVERARDSSRKAEFSPAERARLERRRHLALARAKTAAELENATRAAHRQMLERALAALDEQLDALDESKASGR